MTYEELLAKLKEIYNTTVDEDNDIYEEIKELSKEKYDLYSEDNIKKLEEREFILKNGKTFKDKLKRYFSVLMQGSLLSIFIYIFGIAALIMAYYLTFSLGLDNQVVKSIVYALDAMMTAAFFVVPISSFVQIHKIDKKYNLEEVSLELKNAKERKKFVDKELVLKKMLHDCKQQKLAELRTTIRNITEVINVHNKENVLETEQVTEIKEEGKTLKLERK